MEVNIDFAIETARIIIKIKKLITNSNINKVSTKTTLTDCVTEVDKSIDKYLRKELSKLVPNSSFLTEEDKKTYGNDYKWVIDPIDGTSWMMCGRVYSCSVALQYKNKTIMGIIFIPKTNILYICIKGQGVFEYKAEDILENNYKISNTQIKIAAKKTLPNNYGGFLCYDMAQSYRRYITEIYDIISVFNDKFLEVRSVGPCTIDLIYIVKGMSDAYIVWGAHLWDYCAGALMVEEIGYKTATYKDAFICGKSKYVDLILKVLKEKYNFE